MTKIKSSQTKEYIDASIDPLSGPAEDYIAVTPNDNTVYDPPLKAFRAGSTGNISVVTLAGSTVTINNVLAGETISLQVSRIRATGTSASNIGGYR